MPQYLPLPDGSSVTIREGETPAQTWARAQQMYPEAFGAAPKETPQSGFVPAVKAGYQELKGDIAALAGRAGLTDVEAAEKYRAERKAEAKGIFKPTETWSEAPVTKGLELLGGSLPYMAAPLAAGAVAPAGAATLGAAGLASLAQFTGTNLGRQMDEGAALKETSLASAAAGAVPQAALDIIPMARFIPGVRQIFGYAGKKIGADAAEELVKQGTAKVMADYAKTTGKAMGAEGVTEAAQQFIERLQAGLSLTDASARDEYWQSLIGGAVLGGAIAPAGRAIERGQIKREQTQEADQAARKQAFEQRKAAKEAEDERLKSPDYALEVQQKYDAAEAQRKELVAQKIKIAKGSDTETADRAFNKGIDAQLGELSKTLKPLAAEQARLRPIIRQAQEEKRRAELSPAEYMLEQTGNVPPDTELPPGTMPTPTEPAEVKTSEALQFAAKQIEAAKYNEVEPTADTYVSYLFKRPEYARELVSTVTGLPGLPAKESRKVLDTVRSVLAMRDKESARLGAAGTAASQQRIGTVEAEEQAVLEASRAAEQQAAQDAQARQTEIMREQRIAPEVAGIQRLGKPSEDSFSAANAAAARERMAQRQQDEVLAGKLVETLPTGEKRMAPGRVETGRAGAKGDRKDLQTQLAIARITKNQQAAQEAISGLRDLSAADEVTGRGRVDAETLQALGAGQQPQSMQREAQAEKHVDEQNLIFTGLVRQLENRRRMAGKLTTPGTFQQDVRDAKERYAAEHIAEIESRREALGLKKMADWERGESRARVMEALNELENRWGQIKGREAETGQRTFGAPMEAIKVLQQQMRDNVNSTINNAVTRDIARQAEEVGQKTKPPSGVRLAADEIRLRGEPRRAADERTDALRLIEQVLTNVERRTRAAPAITQKPVEKVGTLEDIARLFDTEKTGGVSEKTDPATVSLLEQLRAELPISTDPEFAKLSREVAQRVMEGNLPNGNDVRDLQEMLLAQRAAGQSVARAGATPEELQRTSAQQQGVLFPEAEVMVQRATPANFQRMLDSKDVQGMREALAELKANNATVLEQFKKYVPNINKSIQTAVKGLNTARAQVAKAKEIAQKDLMEPAWYAPAVRDVVEYETAIQSLPLGIKRLKELLPTLNKALKEEKNEAAAARLKEAIAQNKTDTERLQEALVVAEGKVEGARQKLDRLMTTYQKDVVLRQASQKAAKKATKAQAVAEAKLASLRKKAAEVQESLPLDSTEKALKDAAQAAREGLGLPGRRLIKDTTEMKKRAAQIKSGMGAVEDALAKAKKAGKTDDVVRLQARLDGLEQQLNTLYETSPVVETTLKEKGEALLDQAFEDAQIALAAKQRLAEGVVTQSLAGRRVGPVVKDIKTGLKAQAGERKNLNSATDAATDALVAARAERTELERREKYLKDNGKKVPADLKEKLKDVNARIKEATALLNRVATEERAARQIVTREGQKKVKAELERAAEAGEDAKFEREFSKGAVKNGLTAQTLQAELDKAVGGKGVTQGKVGVFDSVEDFYAKNPDASDDYPDLPLDAKAFVDPKTGKTFMFANNIGKGEGLGVFLHEVGAHLGFRNLFNKAQYNTLVKAVKNWTAKNDGSLESRVATAAIERVEAAKTSDKHYDDELLAYTIEEAVKAGVSPSMLKGGSPIKNWLSTVMGLLKKALAKFGINPDTLTAGDLVNLAYGAAQLEVRGTWHGSDAKFKAFDTKYAGAGEGAFDLRFVDEESLGAGPYTTPDKAYAEYYQHAVPFGKAANETGYGFKSYQDYRANDTKYLGGANIKSVADFQNIYESNLLTRYLENVAQGGELDPTKNTSVQKYLDRLLQNTAQNLENDKRVLASREKRKAKADSVENAREQLLISEKRFKAAQTLDVSKIKGLTERPMPGYLYRSLDAMPREKVYSINSVLNVGDRPKIDALLDKYGTEFTYKTDDTYYANGLFSRMREKLGLKKTIQEFKEAGIEALERKNDERYIERAYIDQAPEILAVDLKPVGPAEGLLFSRAAAPGFEDVLAIASQAIAEKKTISERIAANLGLGFRTQFLDRLAPLEKIATEAMDSLRGTQMMYYLRMADQKMSFVQQAVGRGVPQLKGIERSDGEMEYVFQSEDGPSLAKVVGTLKKAPGMNPAAANQLFTLYLGAKRADRVGYNTLNFGVDEATLRGAVEKIEANDALRDVFEQARDEYNEYNRDLMRFMEQTGALKPEEAKRLAETNDYIPYYREENGNAVLVIGGEGTYKVGNLKDQPQLQQLIGGNEKILDFLTSSVQNTSMLMDMGLRNQATKNAMFELVNLGFAKILNGETSGKDIIRFKEKGVDKYVAIDADAAGIPAELLVKGMEGIPVNNSALVQAMAIPATLLRRAVTLSPLYAARQLFRDSVAAPLLSGADFTPVVGALKQLGNTATREKLESRGIVGGQVFTGTNEDLTRILGELQSGKIGVGQLIARAEAIAMEADALTRRAQYDSYIAQGLSDMEATLMSLESMNFNRKGLSPSVRLASQMIPFFNAQVQSLDVLYRAMTGKMPMNERLDIQGKLYRRGALMAGTAIAYAMMMQDDEAYKNAYPDEKYGNFFVRVPGLDEPIRIPIPFELGYVFKSIPEAMVNIMTSEEGAEEAYKAFKNIAIQTVPGGSSMFLPAAIKPVVENVTNYSFYSGRGIESKAEQMRMPEYRFRDNTSELAKSIGQLTGTSPLKIENLVRGYTGGMGTTLMQSLNFAMPTAGTPEKAAQHLSNAAVIGPLFQPNDAGGIISATYDRVTEIQQVQKSYNDMVQQGRTAEARAFLQERSEDLAKSAIAGNVQQQLGSITKAMNAIKASSMSPDEKREQLDKMQKLRIEIAKNVRVLL